MICTIPKRAAVASLVLLVAAALAPLAAQSHRAVVRGRAVGPSGSPLARAEVRAVHEGTNETRRTSTDESGRFALPELAIGAYRIEIAASGYQTFIRRAELTVGQDLWIDAPLVLAAAQEVGPGSRNVNLAAVKYVPIRGDLRLQLRAEAFNLLNRANFDLPDAFLGSPTFGRILSAQGPRRIQFGMKAVF